MWCCVEFHVSTSRDPPPCAPANGRPGFWFSGGCWRALAKGTAWAFLNRVIHHHQAPHRTGCCLFCSAALLRKTGDNARKAAVVLSAFCGFACVFWVSARKKNHRPPELTKFPMPVVARHKNKKHPAMAMAKGSEVEKGLAINGVMSHVPPARCIHSIHTRSNAGCLTYAAHLSECVEELATACKERQLSTWRVITVARCTW